MNLGRRDSRRVYNPPAPWGEGVLNPSFLLPAAAAGSMPAFSKVVDRVAGPAVPADPSHRRLTNGSFCRPHPSHVAKD